MSEHIAALNELETNPDLDPEERHRLANIIRDRLDELERLIESSGERADRVMQNVFKPPGPRERSVLAWARGSSISIRIGGPEDAEWLEELVTDKPIAIRFRPEPESAKRLANDSKQAWSRGIRAHVQPVRLGPDDDAKNPQKYIDDASTDGDWVLSAPTRRNVGGHTGKFMILTWSAEGLVEVGGKGDGEEEDDGEA